MNDEIINASKMVLEDINTLLEKIKNLKSDEAKMSAVLTLKSISKTLNSKLSE